MAAQRRRADLDSPTVCAHKDVSTTAAGRSLFLSSRAGAARKSIVSTDLADGDKPTRWQVVVPEHAKAVLVRAQALGRGLLLLVYSVDVGHEVRPPARRPPLP